MPKSRQRKKKKSSSVTVIPKKKLSIKEEAKYIIDCAMKNDARMVSLGALIFFSTETGDAWMLDVDDHLAIRLVKEWKVMEYNIIDTPDQFEIAWKYQYSIEGDMFHVVDEIGNARSIFGYPTNKINEMIDKMRHLTNLN